MPETKENLLSATLLENIELRIVEPDIYSVLPDNESGSEYDTPFGFFYNLVACNPLYNRLIWGYSVKIFSRIADEALRSSQAGCVLDLGCGSLAFTAKTFCRYTERPVILLDRSLKMLHMAKAKLLKHNGTVPTNMAFLHGDALQLPFKEKTFATILSQNLLHCLDDTHILLNQLRSIVSENGRMYFTTLVRANRFADNYLESLAHSGKLISREELDHKKAFEQSGLSAAYTTTGNLLVIKENK